MKFDFANAPEGFDNHINQSIRGLDNLYQDVLSISEYFIENNTTFYDIGCSTGKLQKMFAEKYSVEEYEYVEFKGIDSEESFREQWEFDDSRISCVSYDATYNHYQNVSFATCLFTLQFMPREDRLQCLKNLYEGMNEGAGLVVAEKTVSKHSKINEIRNSIHVEYKRKSFSSNEILDKELKLRKMMRTMTQWELEDLFSRAGFMTFDTIWQNHSFVGYLLIK